MIKMTFINPLDFENLFIANLAGTWMIFIIISLIVISVMASKYKVPNLLYLMLLGLFGLIIADWNQVIGITTIILSGLGIGFMITKLFTK